MGDVRLDVPVVEPHEDDLHACNLVELHSFINVAYPTDMQRCPYHHNVDNERGTEKFLTSPTINMPPASHRGTAIKTFTYIKKYLCRSTSFYLCCLRYSSNGVDIVREHTNTE